MGILILTLQVKTILENVVYQFCECNNNTNNVLDNIHQRTLTTNYNSTDQRMGVSSHVSRTKYDRSFIQVNEKPEVNLI